MTQNPPSIPSPGLFGNLDPGHEDFTLGAFSPLPCCEDPLDVAVAIAQQLDFPEFDTRVVIILGWLVRDCGVWIVIQWCHHWNCVISTLSRGCS